MLCPAVLPRKSQVRAAAKMRAVRNENFSDSSLNFDALKDNMLDKNGEAGINPSKMIVGADSEKSVTSTRVVTATALGLLSSKQPEAFMGFVIDPLWRDLTSLSGVQRQVIYENSFFSLKNVYRFKFLLSSSYTFSHLY